MIKEPCNLIQEHSFVNNLKLCALDCGRKQFRLPRNLLIFHFEDTHTRSRHYTNSRQVLAWLGMAGNKQPKTIASNATFAWWVSSCKWISSNWCFPSKDIEYQRILQSDWTWAFWPMTCEAEFSQTINIENVSR